MNYCGYCKSEDSKKLYSTYDIFGNNYYINRCNKCKAFFLTPRPDEDLLKKAYAPNYYGETSEKFISLIENLVDYFRASRARYLSAFLKTGAKVLDIGCGNGRFLSYMSRCDDFQLYGTELDGNSSKRAAQIPGIKLKIGHLKKNDFAPGTFDAITLFHVFEHLTEPAEMLEIISEIIKKDGILIVSFPNITGLQSRLFKGHWFHMDPPRHLFFFAPYDFVKIMESIGFKLYKTKYFSLEQNPYGTIQSILNLFCKKREVLYERLKGNVKYAPEYSPLNIFFQKIFFFSAFPIFAFADLIGSYFKHGATVEFTFKKVKA